MTGGPQSGVAPADGRLAHNITWFARALRKAGLPIGPGRVVDAVRAVEAAGFGEKQDFYWLLHGCFVSRAEHRAVFDQVFRLFWRDPRYLDHMMSLMLPALRGAVPDRPPLPAEKRAAQALLDGVRRPPQVPGDGAPEVEVDAQGTVSALERLRRRDFAQMSTGEMAEARRMLARLTLPAPPLPARRSRPDARGALPDWRRTMQAALRHGGEVRRLERRARTLRPPDLVVLCDISGSMSAYSRMVLHFVHAVANDRGRGQRWGRVHAFTFGTRLTNITRHMAARDADAALAAAGAGVQDWEGGTRIGACLAAFNRDWSRRVLGRGAVVLLITDGLDREDAGDGESGLARQMERLHLSARRLIWLNPLLRWEGFAPKAAGIRAMLPHVDCFRAGHNIAALEDLAQAVAGAGGSGEKARLMALMAAG